MKACFVVVIIGISVLIGTLVHNLLGFQRKYDVLEVGLKRLEMRVDNLAAKPVIFNAQIKVGDEVVPFDRKTRGKVLAVDGDKLWVVFNPHRAPETCSVDSVALVRDAKD